MLHTSGRLQQSQKHPEISRWLQILIQLQSSAMLSIRNMFVYLIVYNYIYIHIYQSKRGSWNGTKMKNQNEQLCWNKNGPTCAEQLLPQAMTVVTQPPASLSTRRANPCTCACHGFWLLIFFGKLAELYQGTTRHHFQGTTRRLGFFGLKDTLLAVGATFPFWMHHLRPVEQHLPASHRHPANPRIVYFQQHACKLMIQDYMIYNI